MENRRPKFDQGKKSTEATLESKETKETLKHMALATVRATVLWTEAIARGYTAHPAKDKGPKLNLSSRNRLNAAFLPAMLMSVLSGCYPEALECSDENIDMFDKTLSFADEHRDGMQDYMDELWGDDSTDVNKIVDTLIDTQIYCFEEGFEGYAENLAPPAGASKRLGKNALFINVHLDIFGDSMDAFNQGVYTQDYDNISDLYQAVELEELINTTHDDVKEDIKAYYFAIHRAADTLTHEAAHIALKSGHSTRKDTRPLQREGYIENVDNVDSWGDAAAAEVDKVANDSIDEYNELQN